VTGSTVKTRFTGVLPTGVVYYYQDVTAEKLNTKIML